MRSSDHLKNITCEGDKPFVFNVSNRSNRVDENGKVVASSPDPSLKASFFSIQSILDSGIDPRTIAPASSLQDDVFSISSDFESKN